MRKEERERMDEALREITVPFLREKGFNGSLPHYRRKRSDRINLLTIQHSLHAARFVVEIANAPLSGIMTSWGEEITPGKINAHHTGQRLRLGSETYKADYWFEYSCDSNLADVYAERAKEIIQLWDRAEAWWARDPYNQRNADQPDDSLAPPLRKAETEILKETVETIRKDFSDPSD